MQELANTAWAFATARHGDARLWHALAAEVTARASATASGAGARGLELWKPQELANTAWAFARAERSAPELFEAIAAEAVLPGRLGDFSAQALANMAWAFAKGAGGGGCHASAPRRGHRRRHITEDDRDANGHQRYR